MKRIFLLILFFLALNIFAQKGKYVEVEMITHPVQMGETIRTISQKYLVEPGEIYQFNKYAVNGIKQGMVLQIPVPVRDPIAVVDKKPATKKLAAPKAEVLDNPKPIAVAKPKSVEKAIVVTDNSKQIEHTVVAKETLYSLSKKYNVSADEIKLANPSIEASGVQIGMVLQIPSKRTLAPNESSIGTTNAPSTSTKTANQTKLGTTVSHTVIAKETFYSLSKKYNVSVEEIQKQNQDLLADGLKIGLVLTIKK